MYDVYDLLYYLTFPAGVGATLPSGQVACVPDEIREIIYCVIGCD